MLNKFNIFGLQFLWFVAAAAGFGQMAGSSKMLGKCLPYYTMQRLNPEDYKLILNCCENTNSHIILANMSS